MQENNKIKVLQILYGGKKLDGVQKQVIRFFENIDKEKFSFDFAFCERRDDSIFNDMDITKNANTIDLNAFIDGQGGYKSYIRMYSNLSQVLDENHYDIVHVNTGNIMTQFICGLVLKRKNIKKRISHSHGSGGKGKKIAAKEFVKNCVRKYICTCYTDLWACSREAGIQVFGEKGIKDSRFRIINNALDVEMFRYDPLISKEVKEKYDVKDKKVFAFVGRLIDTKNVPYAISVFKEIHEEKKDSVFWVIGDGNVRDEVEKRIEECGLTDSVKMWGEVDNVPELMRAIDVLIFPSKYEGLSLVVVEALAAGEYVYCSDTISKEHEIIINRIKFLPLDKDPSYWAQVILNDYDNLIKIDTVEGMAEGGYDIRKATKELEKLYLD